MLLVAGFLLISRRLATRTMLGLVDWHLLMLFGGLFVVTHALGTTACRSRLRSGSRRRVPRHARCGVPMTLAALLLALAWLHASGHASF